MKNLRFELSFSGHGFMGYQKQPHGETVEGCLLNAWKMLTREDAQLIACSRLDTNVNAEHFVFNVHTTCELSPDEILRGLNGILISGMNKEICIYSAAQVDESFHARFQTVGKHYRYLIWHGRSRHRRYLRSAWHVRTAHLHPNLEGLAQHFVGTKDFSAYRSKDCTAQQTVKTIHYIDLWQHPLYPELLIFDIWGSGFLKNMIRNIIGTIIDVSSGKFLISDLHDSFTHGTRERMGQCAPGWGLSLQRVHYEESTYTAAWMMKARHMWP
jgi:tRNA pseudouridine38-40 synthase